MIVACFCGRLITGTTINICPDCMRPVELPTLNNPSGLPEQPELN